MKIVALVCIGLCFMAAQAFAGANTGSGGAVTVASSSGLYVRVVSQPAGGGGGNVCGSAVNTGGVTRATKAVRVGSRVFLKGGGSMIARPRLAVVTTPRPVAARKSPEGLGAVLARILGLT